jgi:hypothetical protein
MILMPLSGASAQQGTSGGGAVFTVQLYFPQPDGRTLPAVGVPVEIQEFAPAAPMMTGRGAPTSISVKKAMSDASGLVRVRLKGRAGRNTVEAVATYQNASFRTGQVPSHQGTASIPLYSVVDASKGLMGGMVCRTEVSESYLLVDCALKLVSRGANAVRLNRNGPKMPFVGLAVGPSGVMNSVITDKRYNHFNARVHSGNVVVKRSARGIFLDGVVLPEAPASIQIRYPIPHLSQKTELALRSDFPLWTFGFELNGPERYAPELQISERVRRNVEVERGRVIHSFQLTEGLATGKVLTMSLANMPVYNPMWRKIVVSGALVFLCLFLALWYRFWRLEREEEDGV